MNRSLILPLGIIFAFAITACSDKVANTAIIAPPSSKAPASISQAPLPAEQGMPESDTANSASKKPESSPPLSGDTSSNTTASSIKESDMTTMQVIVNGKTFTATLEKNVAVDAFVKMLKEDDISINMSDYSGFEKIGSLGTTLPTSNSQMTTTSGDIVLYGSNQIVVFYGSNSWSYTKLGKISDLTGWSDALGYGDATIQFSAN